jgi:hypothetical protein
MKHHLSRDEVIKRLKDLHDSEWMPMNDWSQPLTELAKTAIEYLEDEYEVE